MIYRHPETGRLKKRKLCVIALGVFFVCSFVYVIGYIKLLRHDRYVQERAGQSTPQVFFQLKDNARNRALCVLYFPIIKTTSDGVIWY